MEDYVKSLPYLIYKNEKKEKDTLREKQPRT